MGLFPAEHETIEGVGRALHSGQTTCVEVLEKCFDRIEEWEGRVKAWVRVDREGAIAQARSLDTELAEGKRRGPLHGIPFGIKDIIDVKGLPTAAGFRPWRDRVAEKDADVVASLREAGAVIMGKTVTTQFAWIDPPPTRNPWNLDRTPGGSSSGSAAAVALGMCLGAIGTQTGGSIIRPAAFCGVAGFKPAHGRVLNWGVLPFAPGLDHIGPIARTTIDLIRINHQIQSPLGGLDRLRRDMRRMSRGIPLDADDHSVPRWERFSPDNDGSPGLSAPPKLLRLRGFYDRRAEPAALEAFENALATFASAGAEIVEAPDDIFDFENLVTRHRVVMAAEVSAGHEARLAAQPDDYAPHIRSLVEEGLTIPAWRYIQAWDARRHKLSPRCWNGFDPEIAAIVTPATIGPAPDTSTTGNPCFQSPWSYLGWPALTFPIGLSPDGLPLGIQLVGDQVQEVCEELFEAAFWCESAIRRAARAGSD